MKTILMIIGGILSLGIVLLLAGGIYAFFQVRSAVGTLEKLAVRDCYSNPLIGDDERLHVQVIVKETHGGKLDTKTMLAMCVLPLCETKTPLTPEQKIMFAEVSELIVKKDLSLDDVGAFQDRHETLNVHRVHH